MKNKIKKSIISIVFIAGGIIVLNTMKNDTNTSLNDYLQLENIEALAASETGNAHLCIGSGSVDCNGYKTAVAYFRLNF